MSTIFFRAIKYTPIWARKWLLNPLLGLVSNTYLPIVNDVPGVREVAFEANKFHQVEVTNQFFILVDFFTFGNVLSPPSTVWSLKEDRKYKKICY